MSRPFSSRSVVVGAITVLFVGMLAVVSSSVWPVLPAASAALVDHAPVARVNGMFVPFVSFRYRSERNIRLWRDSLPAHEAAIRAEQAALQELITEHVITGLLHNAGVSVSDADVDTEYGNMARLAGGSSAFRTELAGYGWTEATFKTETVRPAAELAALQRVFLSEPLIAALPAETEMRTRAVVMKERLASGVSFDNVSTLLFSNPSSHVVSSDLGWNVVEQMDAWFREALVNAQRGDVVGPVRSPIGYHVFLVQDAQDTGVNRSLQLSEMLFSTPDTFAPWLDSQLRAANVSIYLPGVQWKEGKIFLTGLNL